MPLFKTNVEKLKAEGNIKGLLKALKNKKTRTSAQEVLCEIGAAVVEPLIATLKDKNIDVRVNAMRVLAEIGEAAVEPLISALIEYNVRYYAVIMLGEIGDARAVEPLIRCLSDVDGYMRKYTAEALGRIGDVHAVEPLIAAVKDVEPAVRSAACDALGEITGASVKELTIAQIHDEWEGILGIMDFVQGVHSGQRASVLISIDKLEKLCDMLAEQFVGGEKPNSEVVQMLDSSLSGECPLCAARIPGEAITAAAIIKSGNTLIVGGPSVTSWLTTGLCPKCKQSREIILRWQP